jgi:hypothetical protein
MKYGQSIKSHAPQTTPIGDLLKGIQSGEFYTHAYDAFKYNGFTHAVVGFAVCKVIGINLDYRYSVQTVTIPTGQKGNISEFAGKSVDIVLTVISKGSPQIAMWIKEHN